MPFVDAAPGPAGRVADGLTEDIITRLAKLRVLFVIARGTVYALRERGIGAEEAGRILNVEYVVSGSVRRQDGRISVVVELAETEGARIVWTDELEGVADDTFSVLDAIVDRIVAAIAEEIEAAECNRAILKPPSSLDAWEAYHRGLWHMYKFNGPDNRDAELFFRSAIRLDPTFARAYAGLSFTHFQNAFLDLTPDRERQIELAFEAAGRSVGADDRDPAGALGDGARPLAARRARASRSPSSSGASSSARTSRSGTTRSASCTARPAIRERRSRRRTTRARSARSTRCSSRCSRVARSRTFASASSKRPPTGRSRRPDARTRTRTSWRSPPSAWRS